MIAEWRGVGRELPPIDAKPSASFRLVSMAGRRHLSLLRESLHSFARHVSQIPPLTVLSDGTLGRADFEAALSFWPNPVEVWMPSDVMDSLSPELRSLIDPLVKANPLGLKLAGVIAMSSRGPIFFSDSDILWFSDPLPQLKRSIGNFKIAVSREEGCSVNRELAKKYAPELLKAPSANSGCILTNYDLATEVLLSELLVEASNQLGDEFNEQTIFGILSHIRGGYFPSELCLIAFEDAFYFNNRNPRKEDYCSRHYVRFMRHQFYRDIHKTQ